MIPVVPDKRRGVYGDCCYKLVINIRGAVRGVVKSLRVTVCVSQNVYLEWLF